MSDKVSPHISRAGFGKTGFCKLCNFVDARLLNDKIKAGWNSRQCQEWLRTQYNVTVNLQTFYTHKNEHLTRPEDRLVTAVQKTRAGNQMLPRVSSNEQYLETIRDIGYKRAIDNPDEVTIDHGLKAASILASRPRGGGDVVILLAKIMTGGDRPYEVIEGTVTEVVN